MVRTKGFCSQSLRIGLQIHCAQAAWAWEEQKEAMDGPLSNQVFTGASQEGRLPRPSPHTAVKKRRSTTLHSQQAS